MQLWLLSLLVVLALPAAFAVLGVLPPEASRFVNTTGARAGLAALLVAVVGYVIEGERSLRRLTGLLLDERTRTSVLEARVDELDLLLRASRAMNASLELDAVLGIIVASASELLGADAEVGDEPSSEGLSVPLLHRDERVGVLNVVAPSVEKGVSRHARSPGEEDFTDLQLRSLEVLAETAAAAISNARLHADTEASVATLTELDRLKDEFLALVTHELRTPLTSIIGLAQTIERGGDRLMLAKVVELAQLIARQGWRLDRLVDDLLRATQIQRGLLAMRPAPVDVTALARETVAGLRNGTHTHTLAMELPDEPVVRVLDGDAVQRILVNLLGNAAQYTPAGSVIRLKVDGSEPDRVVLVVEDDGPGIPEPEWGQVFDKFRRGEGHSSGGGLGLGLYLVRALAFAHGGEATLDRGPRGGARFTVSLGAPA